MLMTAVQMMTLYMIKRLGQIYKYMRTMYLMPAYMMDQYLEMELQMNLKNTMCQNMTTKMEIPIVNM